MYSGAQNFLVLFELFHGFINGEVRTRKKYLCMTRNLFPGLVKNLHLSNSNIKIVAVIGFMNNCQKITESNYKNCIEIITSFSFDTEKLHQYKKDIMLFLNTVCDALEHLDDEDFIDLNERDKFETIFIIKQIEEMGIKEKLNYIYNILDVLISLDAYGGMHKIFLLIDDREMAKKILNDDDFIKRTIYNKYYAKRKISKEVLSDETKRTTS
jgi:hypothetical protein